MQALQAAAGVLVSVLLTTACAVQMAQPGMSREDVISRFGAPSRVLPLGAGTRLQYSGQPAGQTAVMVDLDAAGKVVRAREVLTQAEFSKIEVGKWTRADVEREFGRPARIDRVASWSGDIMNYRWLDAGADKLFWVYLDAGNVVQRTGQGFEYREIRIRRKDDN